MPDDPTTPGVTRSPAGAYVDTRIAAVGRVIEAMKHRLQEPQSLADMAQTALFSRFHFHRIFREVTSVTPARYLAALRMAEAKRLLVHSSLTVTDISVRVGYDSLGTFTTQFGRLVGVPPGKFRDLVAEYGGRVTGGLRSGLAAPASPRERGPVAVIGGRTPADGCFMVGLFRSGLPQEHPERCAVALEPGPVRMAGVVRPGTYSAFALSVDAGATVAEAFIDEAAGARYVGGSVATIPTEGQSGSRFTIALRPPAATDPPVLSVVPLLGLLGMESVVRRAPAPVAT